MDTRGRKLAEFRRIERSRAAPPVYIVQQDRTYGLADLRGRLITPLRYSAIFEADPVYFRVTDKEGFKFYIDRDGQEYKARE